jgi:hypothetical protein
MTADEKAQLRIRELDNLRAMVSSVIPENDKDLIRGIGMSRINLDATQLNPKDNSAPPELTAQPPELSEPITATAFQPHTDDLNSAAAPIPPPAQLRIASEPTKLVSLNESSDPTRELLYDQIEHQLRLKRRRRERGVDRVTVTVSEDVFSAVSYLSYCREMDKIEILTFLLDTHLPRDQAETIPNWLLKNNLETTKKDCHLSYIEDVELKRALAWLAVRYELYTVDIVESIVLRYLPKSPFPIRPKRKVKAVGPARTQPQRGSRKSNTKTD